MGRSMLISFRMYDIRSVDHDYWVILAYRDHRVRHGGVTVAQTQERSDALNRVLIKRSRISAQEGFRSSPNQQSLQGI